MAYNEFAYFYDEFNGEADYEALYAHIKKELEAHSIHDGILADLGCGTGELTLMLTQAGYDMIGRLFFSRVCSISSFTHRTANITHRLKCGLPPSR